MFHGRFDMHTHTTASDGAFTPAGLVQMAYDMGLSGLAITDHDTLAGLDEAGDAIELLNMRLLPGVELSCEYAIPGGAAYWRGIVLRICHSRRGGARGAYAGLFYRQAGR